MKLKEHRDFPRERIGGYRNKNVEEGWKDAQKTFGELEILEELSEEKVEQEIDFWVQHLVAKVTDKNDYISRDKRIEGHIQAIAQAICKRFGTKGR